MPKLLFFDIDNTILDEKTQTIPVEVRQALKQAKQNGHFLFIKMCIRDRRCCWHKTPPHFPIL